MLSRSLISCSRCNQQFRILVSGFAPTLHPTRFLRNDTYQRLSASFKPPWEDRESVRRKLSKFRITMSEEEKEHKLKAIEQSKQEEQPEGLFAKLKFYIKRYWYIAIPVHTINCSIWFIAFYIAVRSGIDIVNLMETLHMPESVIMKIKNVPESAGHVVIAFILYKLAIPLRYATTLALIRVTFTGLKKFGWLRTAREIEFQVRNRYETLNKRRLSAASQLIWRDKEKNVKRVGKPPVPKTK